MGRGCGWLAAVLAGALSLAAAEVRTVFVVASGDTEINQAAAFRGKPQGAKRALRIRREAPDKGGTQSHALLRWDLGAIPKSAKVVSAEIRMQLGDANAGKSAVFALSGWRWNEGDATWDGYEAARPREKRLGEFTGVPVGVGPDRRPFSRGPTLLSPHQTSFIWGRS